MLQRPRPSLQTQIYISSNKISCPTLMAPQFMPSRLKSVKNNLVTFSLFAPFSSNEGTRCSRSGSFGRWREVAAFCLQNLCHCPFGCQKHSKNVSDVASKFCNDVRSQITQQKVSAKKRRLTKVRAITGHVKFHLQKALPTVVIFKSREALKKM